MVRKYKRRFYNAAKELKETLQNVKSNLYNNTFPIHHQHKQTVQNDKENQAPSTYSATD